MPRVVVVSSDCHAGLHLDRYKEFLESRYHEDFDRYLAARPPRAPRDNAQVTDWDERRAFSGANDSRDRLTALERDGVVAEVLFPDGTDDNEIPFSGAFGDTGSNPELSAAGQRAYNRWMADYVDPVRQVGLAVIGYDDIDAAVKETHQAADAGMGGILVGGVQPQLPALYEDYYEPLWAAAAETGLPVHFHGGSGAPNGLVEGLERGPVRFAITASEVMTFFSHRPLWFLIWGGVLERHPEMKIVFVEQGNGWVLQALEHMDWQWDTDWGGQRELIPMRPSDYWRRQGMLGSSLLSRKEVEKRHEIGLSQMMFGNDFPHVPSPSVGKLSRYLRATMGASGVPEDEARAMLGENAIRFYNLDRDKLVSIAEKVGPTVEEVISPPEAEDDPIVLTWSSRGLL